MLADPTYAGYSTGRWEGDTLVVDTVALSDKSFIDGSSPHSDQMTVHERIRFIEPGVLENQITVNDPVALTEPGASCAVIARRRIRTTSCASSLAPKVCARGRLA